MTKKATTINIYFGGKHLDTLERMDTLAKQLRMSRSALIDYLITFYEDHGCIDTPKQVIINGVRYVVPVDELARYTQ